MDRSPFAFSVEFVLKVSCYAQDGFTLLHPRLIAARFALVRSFYVAPLLPTNEFVKEVDFMGWPPWTFLVTMPSTL